MPAPESSYSIIISHGAEGGKEKSSVVRVSFSRLLLRNKIINMLHLYASIGIGQIVLVFSANQGYVNYLVQLIVCGSNAHEKPRLFKLGIASGTLTQNCSSDRKQVTIASTALVMAKSIPLSRT